MFKMPLALGLLVFAYFSNLNQQNPSQDKPKDAAPAAESAAGERKNPVKPTPEGLALAKKLYGYDCAICHAANGDGKGELVKSMDLQMKDWQQPGSLDKITDAEMFDIISKGKGKMVGEGDRLAPDRVWMMVNYVRALAKKEGN